MKILINYHRLPVETGLKIKSSDPRYYSSFRAKAGVWLRV